MASFLNGIFLAPIIAFNCYRFAFLVYAFLLFISIILIISGIFVKPSKSEEQINDKETIKKNTNTKKTTYISIGVVLLLSTIIIFPILIRFENKDVLKAGNVSLSDFSDPKRQCLLNLNL